MSCEQFKERLLDFALDAERGDAALAAHLDSCAACRAELGAQRRMVAAMDRALAEDVAAEPSPAFAAGVRRRIDDAEAPSRWAGWPAWIPAAVGLALFALFAAWILLRAPAGLEREPEIARSSPPVKVQPPKQESSAPVQKPVSPTQPKGSGPRIVITASAREPKVIVPKGEAAALRQFVEAMRSPRVNAESIVAITAPNVVVPLQASEELKIQPLEIRPLEVKSEPLGSTESRDVLKTEFN
jgi:hypothetical protein